MLKDITLGQYFPGNSPVHKLDPRTKLILLIVYIVALFTAVSWLSYGLCLLFLVAVVAISQIPPKSLLRGMKPMIFRPVKAANTKTPITTAARNGRSRFLRIAGG